MNYKINILDCTLRDGGYYTAWDFNNDIIKVYIDAMNILPISYIEVGYRNNPQKDYVGQFGYCPVSLLSRIGERCNKKLVIMLNEKNVKLSDIDNLLKPIIGLIDMIRLAIDPINLNRAINLAKSIKSMGFEVGFNVMYMSKWSEYDGFIDDLEKINGIADLFCMVDSYGGVFPNDIKEISRLVKSKVSCPIGFHGHNNLQLAFINTLTAIEEGVDFVDATVLGMGRGAGNLNLELLLTYLAKFTQDVDFNILGELITSFTPLYEKFCWGTNLPYMLSGANSIPQKEVMEWVTNRAYSLNSIIRALDNKRNRIKDNAQYPVLKMANYESVLIIGGGSSVCEHINAIKEYLNINKKTIIIFATARHAALFKDIDNIKLYCLVGNEAKRLSALIDAMYYKGICVLPPYPRIMGTEVPKYAEDTTYELSKIHFTQDYLDSCTTVALELAIECEAKSIFIVGYDGYKGEILSDKEAQLTYENRSLFDMFKNYTCKKLVSLTPSLYKSLDVESIYQYIY